MEQDSPLAVLDVRESGEYNTAHIPLSTSLPRRDIEYRLRLLVPAYKVQVVICDDDGRRARLAARTVSRMGYERVAVLEGGINQWASLGLPTEWGMNVVSKAFGERIEAIHQVPTIEPTELARRLRRGELFRILDTRTPEEFSRYCIPGGRSVPGGELVLRITDILRENADAPIVVNCAGRTRSIIGTRLLLRMGFSNVAALKNGTSGWLLAGLELERGARRLDLSEPSAEAVRAAEAFATQIAAEDGVGMLSVADLAVTTVDAPQAPDGPVYLVDIRTEPEYDAGHIPGFHWFPGGQAVQRADDLAAVRAGRIVFCCDGIARSTVAASWYRQMGFSQVFVVLGGVRAWLESGRELTVGREEHQPAGLAEASQRIRLVNPGELHEMLNSGNLKTLLFVDTSDQFSRGHIAGSTWLPRGWLEFRIEAMVPDTDSPVAVSDRLGANAVLAADTLCQMGYRDVVALRGGLDAWTGAGLPVEQGLNGIMTPPDDIVAAGSERSFAQMIQYLTWEEALGDRHTALKGSEAGRSA